MLALNQPPPASWATRASWDTVECRGVEPRGRCLQGDAVHQHPPRGLASQRAASNRLPPLYESGAPPVVLRWRSRRRGLNPLPHAYKARAHPVVLHRRRWCPRRDSNAHRRRSRRRASASWATRADRAGNGGFEPPRAGSEPAMLPVTSAPKGGPAVGSRRHRFSAGGRDQRGPLWCRRLVPQRHARLSGGAVTLAPVAAVQTATVLVQVFSSSPLLVRCS